MLRTTPCLPQIEQCIQLLTDPLRTDKRTLRITTVHMLRTTPGLLQIEQLLMDRLRVVKHIRTITVNPRPHRPRITRSICSLIRLIRGGPKTRAIEIKVNNLGAGLRRGREALKYLAALRLILNSTTSDEVVRLFLPN